MLWDREVQEHVMALLMKTNSSKAKVGLRLELLGTRAGVLRESGLLHHQPPPLGAAQGFYWDSALQLRLM